jgi:hypothetical protein
MRGELPARDLDPKDPSDRLREFLEMLIIQVEPELEEPEAQEVPPLHDAPTWLNRSYDGKLLIIGIHYS